MEKKKGGGVAPLSYGDEKKKKNRSPHPHPHPPRKRRSENFPSKYFSPPLTYDEKKKKIE